MWLTYTYARSLKLVGGSRDWEAGRAEEACVDIHTDVSLRSMAEPPDRITSSEGTYLRVAVVVG